MQKEERFFESFAVLNGDEDAVILVFDKLSVFGNVGRNDGESGCHGFKEGV